MHFFPDCADVGVVAIMAAPRAVIIWGCGGTRRLVFNSLSMVLIRAMLRAPPPQMALTYPPGPLSLGIGEGKGGYIREGGAAPSH